jgi:6-phosphofructokinase 1
MTALSGRLAVVHLGNPTAVSNQVTVGVVQAALRKPGVRGISGIHGGWPGLVRGELLDLGRFSSEQLERTARVPGSVLGTAVSVDPLFGQEGEAWISECRRREIRWLFCVGPIEGGRAALRLRELAARTSHEMFVFHLAVSSENEIEGADHTPGFGSAARFVALAVMGENESVRALGGIRIVVVPARRCGFLAAASVLARRGEGDGPHRIYLPEQPFQREAFAESVESVYRSMSRCLAVVSEGVGVQAGDLLVRGLVDELRAGLGSSVPVSGVSLGDLPWSFPDTVSYVDAREARRMGMEGVRMAFEGNSSGSVLLRRVDAAGRYEAEPFLAPLDETAVGIRKVQEHHCVSGGGDVRDAFRSWVEPLVDRLPKLERFPLSLD